MDYNLKLTVHMFAACSCGSDPLSIYENVHSLYTATSAATWWEGPFGFSNFSVLSKLIQLSLYILSC
jgi:hypothetical protein